MMRFLCFYRQNSSAFHFADLAQLRGKGNLVETFDRQSDESRDPVTQVTEGLGEGAFFLDFRAFDRGRVFDAPMRGHRLSRPCGTGFARSVVTEREREIQLW